MKIIQASVEVLTPINGEEILKHIEKIGRVCYKSENSITPDSSKKFVADLIKRGHEAMIEHFNISVKFICDRGVTHEIVRHRIASYAQESTRYCNYNQEKFGKEIIVIKPLFWHEDSKQYQSWRIGCLQAEITYFELLTLGASPQEARSVLPNSLKTEIVITMNLRELRHFFRLRTSKAAHPQMREVAIMLLEELKGKIPVIFDDIEVK